MQGAKINTSSLASPPQDKLIDQIIAGKYRINRLIGHGGMGTVYEGYHLLLERTIAIKVMRGPLAEDDRAAARFLREAKTAAKMEHPNAVTIYDFGMLENNMAYIVMEYIGGCSLRQWLNQNGAVNPIQTVEWLVQACEAVAAAHEQGIIHRDIKPENIMLKEGIDGKLTVKVVDFGLAKIISSDSNGGANLTKTGEVIGTPYYMAPEFYDGEELDQRVDIYALGIIAYEMLTGQSPFTGTVENIIAGHLFKEVPPLYLANSDLAAGLDLVIRKALKKNRVERLSTAEEFVVGLKSLALPLSPLVLPNSNRVDTVDKNSPTTQYIAKDVSATTISGVAPTTLITPVTAAIESVNLIHPTVGNNKDENKLLSVPSRSPVRAIVLGVAILAVIILALTIKFWPSASSPDLPANTLTSPSVAEEKPSESLTTKQPVVTNGGTVSPHNVSAQTNKPNVPITSTKGGSDSKKANNGINPTTTPSTKEKVEVESNNLGAKTVDDKVAPANRSSTPQHTVDVATTQNDEVAKKDSTPEKKAEDKTKKKKKRWWNPFD